MMSDLDEVEKTRALSHFEVDSISSILNIYIHPYENFNATQKEQQR